ncbi:MAG: redoxin domain-containing protein [Deltaproteobacteria bacterium]|nr:redoxin domain-containing protein [Deltaproteobacteria bacterium]
MKNLKLIVVMIATVFLGATFDPNHPQEDRGAPVPSQKNQYLGSCSGYHVLIDPLGSKAPGFGWEWTVNYRYIPMSKPGKITIWHFFSPDCHHCEVEMPALDAFYRVHKNEVHLIAFGVGQNNHRKALAEYRKKQRLSMNILPQDEVDVNSPAFVMGVFVPHLIGNGPEGYWESSIPVTFIIDQEGIVRFIIRRRGDWSDTSLESIFIQELTGKQDAASRDLEEYLTAMKDRPANDQNSAAWTMAVSQYHLEEAKGLAERAVAQEQDNPFYLGTLGTIQYLFGEYDEALVTLEKAIALHSDDDPKAVDTFYLGLTYFAQGDYCNAKRFLTKSLELDDNSAYAVYAIGVLIDMERMEVGLGTCLHQTESKPISL